MNPIISVVVPDGQPLFYQLHEHDPRETPVSWAFVVVSPTSPKTASLWYIQTRKKHQGKGYAQELIKGLQGYYDKIITNYEKGPITGEGTKLCMKCGFELKPSLFKNIPNELIWERKNAKSNGTSPEETGKQDGESREAEREEG